MPRSSLINRKTNETEIQISLDIDGAGFAEIDTGIGFFDHMLTSFAKHGLFDLKVKVTGDLHVDSHHTIEDTGIALGTAIREALGEKLSIRRYGSCILPMDETLILCAMDLSGRPFLAFEAAMQTPAVGGFDTQMLKEFFYAVTYSAGMNLHIKLLNGDNSHHIIEAAFKSFARALDESTITDDRIHGIPSTKGSL